MNISAYHIQNVIRAYGQRSGRTRGLARRGIGSVFQTKDVITISPEAKKRQIEEKVAADVMNRVRGQNQEEQLSQDQNNVYDSIDTMENGFNKLDITSDIRGRHKFKFRVIDPENGESVREITSEDTEKLMENIQELNPFADS